MVNTSWNFVRCWQNGVHVLCIKNSSCSSGSSSSTFHQNSEYIYHILLDMEFTLVLMLFSVCKLLLIYSKDLLRTFLIFWHLNLTNVKKSRNSFDIKFWRCNLKKGNFVVSLITNNNTNRDTFFAKGWKIGLHKSKYVHLIREKKGKHMCRYMCCNDSVIIKLI